MASRVLGNRKEGIMTAPHQTIVTLGWQIWALVAVVLAVVLLAAVGVSF
jgi:hypothetical protein